MRITGMGFIRTWAIPQRADHLSNAECEQRAEPGGGDAVTPVARAPLPAREEQAGQQHQEHDLALLGEEAKHLFEGVVAVGEFVELFVEV